MSENGKSTTQNSRGQNFITEVSLQSANLSPKELLIYQSLAQDTFTDTITLVTMGDPWDFMDRNGNLTFVMPRVTDTIVAKIVDITQTENSQGWLGNMSTHDGSIAIYKIDSMQGSWIQVDGTFFEIMPINSQISTMREIARNIDDPFDCPLTSAALQLVDEYCQDEYNTCHAQIDILVLYPPDVTAYLANRFGAAPQIIPLFIQIGTYHAIHAAFSRSDIPNKRVSVKGEAFNFQYTTPYSYGTALPQLESQAASRRNATGADIVILLTNVNYPGGAGAAEGLPQGATDPAYAIVEIPWLINPRWTFAHEFGHLVGARHDRASDNHDDCGHGWAIDNNRFQRTIMDSWFGTQDPTDIRVLHFSNPDVTYNGAPTGTSDNDNAKTIRNAACEVSAYKTSTTFGINPIVLPLVCYDGSSYTITWANVQQPAFGNPGVAPYTYEWRWNTSGDFDADPGTMFGNTAFATLTIPNEESIWVRLRVVSDDDITLFAFRKMWIFPCTPFQDNPGGSSRIVISSPIVYPNPASNEIHVEFESLENGKADMVVYDQSGSLVYLQEGKDVFNGVNRAKLDISSLPSGLYTCSVKVNNSIEQKSIGFVISR